MCSSFFRAAWCGAGLLFQNRLEGFSYIIGHIQLCIKHDAALTYLGPLNLDHIHQTMPAELGLSELRRSKYTAKIDAHLIPFDVESEMRENIHDTSP